MAAAGRGRSSAVPRAARRGAVRPVSHCSAGVVRPGPVVSGYGGPWTLAARSGRRRVGAPARTPQTCRRLGRLHAEEDAGRAHRAVRARHFVVDEYQDVSPLQQRLL
ncbi:hypothetical protein ABTX84_20625, partial [Streptomyces sp. NPDC095614]|uniref:hypothetical protein n=1 Tax=Streptomyces sp. NPDC095614 TaxID=3156692 RepID=UPI0033227441